MTSNLDRNHAITFKQKKYSSLKFLFTDYPDTSLYPTKTTNLNSHRNILPI